jgi:hypothetical protein
MSREEKPIPAIGRIPLSECGFSVPLLVQNGGEKILIIICGRIIIFHLPVKLCIFSAK